MRRVARRLFTVCSAVSLLLAAGVCLLWVRSYRVHDVWGFYTGDAEPVREYSFNSGFHGLRALGSARVHLRRLGEPRRERRSGGELKDPASR
jgi:hypothetical protein